MRALSEAKAMALAILKRQGTARVDHRHISRRDHLQLADITVTRNRLEFSVPVMQLQGDIPEDFEQAEVPRYPL